MDTDDLTEDAYETIRLAREASPFLGAQLAVSGAGAQSEDEFLRSMLRLVDEFAEDPEGTSDDLDGELSPTQLVALCITLRTHILQTLAKPGEARGDAPI